MDTWIKELKCTQMYGRNTRRRNNREKTFTIPSKYHATLEKCKQIGNNSRLQGDATKKQAVRLSPKRRGFYIFSTVAKSVRMGHALPSLQIMKWMCGRELGKRRQIYEIANLFKFLWKSKHWSHQILIQFMTTVSLWLHGLCMPLRFTTSNESRIEANISDMLSVEHPRQIPLQTKTISPMGTSAVFPLCER